MTEFSDPFKGVRIGDLVRIVNGPRGLVGRDALVVERDLITGVGEDSSSEDYDANIGVLLDGSQVNLWVGWVEMIEG
jgi:hypothetical protein